MDEFILILCPSAAPPIFKHAGHELTHKDRVTVETTTKTYVLGTSHSCGRLRMSVAASHFTLGGGRTGTSTLCGTWGWPSNFLPCFGTSTPNSYRRSVSYSSPCVSTGARSTPSSPSGSGTGRLVGWRLCTVTGVRPGRGCSGSRVRTSGAGWNSSQWSARETWRFSPWSFRRVDV